MPPYRKINPILRQKYEQELEQVKLNSYESMRNRMEKKKISMLALCSKKDLHFILNSMLGDIFEQDILNQFWQAHFQQTASVSEILKMFNTAIVNLLQTIIQNNIMMHELSKEKEKYKQDHNFKYHSLVSSQLEQVAMDTNQYVADLEELCKPFNINLAQLIQKYKPYRLKERITAIQDDLEPEPNALLELELTQIKNQNAVLEEGTEINQEEKFYKFYVYLTIIIFLVDLSVSLIKFNYLDLTIDILLVLNAALEFYIFRDDPSHEETADFIIINYEDNRIMINDVINMPMHLKTMTISQDVNSHSFDKFAYASFCLLSISVLYGLIWILVMRGGYMSVHGPNDPLVVTGAGWKYSQYVFYASEIVVVVKGFMLLLLGKIVEFNWRCLASKFNLYMNFLRFTSTGYINQFVINGNS